jgi:hypothetical protein
MISRNWLQTLLDVVGRAMALDASKPVVRCAGHDGLSGFQGESKVRSSTVSGKWRTFRFGPANASPARRR